MNTALEWVLDAIILICAVLIALNSASLLSWLYASARRGGNSGYSFAPPFVCGIVATGRLSARLAWLPLVLDPSIGFVLVGAALQKLRSIPNR